MPGSSCSAISARTRCIAGCRPSCRTTSSITRAATNKGYRVLRARRRSGTGMTQEITLPPVGASPGMADQRRRAEAVSELQRAAVHQLGRPAQSDVLAVAPSRGSAPRRRRPAPRPARRRGPRLPPSAGSPAPPRRPRCRRTASRRCRARARASGCVRPRRPPAARPAPRTRRSRRLGRRRRDDGRRAEVERVELGLVGQRDHDVRVADADRQAGAIDGAGSSPTRRLAVEHDERPEVGLEALGRARQGAHSPAGADRDRFALGELDQAVLDEETAEDADAVAAHLGRAAVGVVVVHEPLGGRILGQRRGSGVELRRPHRADHPIGAHAEVAVGDAGEGIGIQLDLAVGVGEQHEVVAGAVTLGEVECRAHGSGYRRPAAARHDGGRARVVGVDPSRRRVAPEPSHLPPGIAPGERRGLLDRLRLGQDAVELGDAPARSRSRGPP